MLDLALAVDRGIGHDRDRLVDVIREIRAGDGQRRERTVPTERADGLGGGLGHVLRHAQVVRLEAERRELLLATAGDVLELVRRRADLPTWLGFAPRTASFSRVARLVRTSALEAIANAGKHDAARFALRRETIAQPGLANEPPPRDIAAQRDALAGAQRVRVAHVTLERHEPALAREDVRIGRLDVPQRAQAERVHAEHAGVADPREERGGALCEGTECGTRLDVDVLQPRRHTPDLVDDRGEEELDGLERAQAQSQDERADDGVDVLRVAAVARERQTQRARLLAQATDRVDLAVVREHRERLDPVEARARVGGVAVVAEGHAGRETFVAQIVEVREQLLGATAQLVHGAMARERDDGRGGEPLDLHARLVQRARCDTGATGSEQRELPEARLLGTAARSEDLARRDTRALEQDRDAMPREDAPDRGLLRVVGRAGDEHVSDGEPIASRIRGIAPGLFETGGPQRARDVDEHAGTVTLAIHAPGAVGERPHAGDDLAEHARVGSPVPPGYRDQTAGVALVHSPPKQKGLPWRPSSASSLGVCD